MHSKTNLLISELFQIVQILQIIVSIYKADLDVGDFHLIKATQETPRAKGVN